MSKYKVVLLDEIVEVDRDRLAEIDAEVVRAVCRTPEEIIAAAADADAVSQVYVKLSGDTLKELKKCKVIGHDGIGLDSIDIPGATEAGIAVCNVPQYCQEEVSTHAIGLLISVARKLDVANSIVRDGKWKQALNACLVNRSFVGRKMGLLGFGSIAQYAVPKAKAFGMEVIAYDPYMNEAKAEALGVTPVSFDELLSEADYISVHVPFIESTYHLLSKDEFAKMKDGVIIINTARGPIIDQEALVEALKSGKVAGAGLDVLEQEPPLENDPRRQDLHLQLFLILKLQPKPPGQ